MKKGRGGGQTARWTLPSLQATEGLGCSGSADTKLCQFGSSDPQAVLLSRSSPDLLNTGALVGILLPGKTLGSGLTNRGLGGGTLVENAGPGAVGEATCLGRQPPSRRRGYGNGSMPPTKLSVLVFFFGPSFFFHNNRSFFCPTQPRFLLPCPSPGLPHRYSQASPQAPSSFSTAEIHSP